VIDVLTQLAIGDKYECW